MHFLNSLDSNNLSQDCKEGKECKQHRSCSVGNHVRQKRTIHMLFSSTLPGQRKPCAMCTHVNLVGEKRKPIDD